MATRAEIIAEARDWIGTPWRHQGRLKHIACDCVGHILCVPRALGLFPPDFNPTGYSRTPDPKIMLSYLKQYLDRVAPGQEKGGDVFLMRPRRIPQHLAIYTGKDNTIIHAIDEQRGVREHILDKQWRGAICSVWSYRGVSD